MQNEALNFNKFTQAIFHCGLFYSAVFAALWQLYLLALRAGEKQWPCQRTAHTLRQK